MQAKPEESTGGRWGMAGPGYSAAGVKHGQAQGQ